MIRSLLVAGAFLFFALPGAAEAAPDGPRIVSQSPYISATLEWMGLGNCIVGASRYDHRAVPSTGGILDPDREAIHALEPDLLLTSRWTDAERWRAVAPESASALILEGFDSMAQIAANIRRISVAVGRDDGEALAASFEKRWREAAAGVDGGDQRVLLLSACSGQPYSFGPGTWLFELFETMGFEPVENHAGVRHLERDDTAHDLVRLTRELEPDLLLVFNRQMSTQCAALPTNKAIPYVALDGDLFLHPAPTLIRGIKGLQQRADLLSTAETASP